MEFIWICNGDSHHPGHGMMIPSTLCRNIEGYWEERLIWDFNVICDLFVRIWCVPNSIVAIWFGLLLVLFDISGFSQFSLCQKTLFSTQISILSWQCSTNESSDDQSNHTSRYTYPSRTHPSWTQIEIPSQSLIPSHIPIFPKSSHYHAQNGIAVTPPILAQMESALRHNPSLWSCGSPAAIHFIIRLVPNRSRPIFRIRPNRPILTLELECSRKETLPLQFDPGK